VHEAHSKREIDQEEAEKRGYKELDHDYYLEEVSRPGEYMEIAEDEHGTYIMNSRDMCLVEYLKELKDAGVCSFKVEGRNKTVFYVATVAKTYRQAIDDMEAGKPFNPEYITELAKTSNRGFIPGFLMANPREKAQEYKKRITHQTHEFVGIVRNIHERDNQKFYEVEVKGRIDVPDTVEVFSPSKSFKYEMVKITNLKGEEVKTVHPGQKDNVLIQLPEEVEIGAMIRKERANHI
jgi:putative protease